MFKPTETETPKSKSFGDYAPNTGQPGDAVRAAPDPAKSLFQPVEVQVPKSESFGDYAPNTGQAGDVRA